MHFLRDSSLSILDEEIMSDRDSLNSLRGSEGNFALLSAKSLSNVVEDLKFAGVLKSPRNHSQLEELASDQQSQLEKLASDLEELASDMLPEVMEEATKTMSIEPPRGRKRKLENATRGGWTATEDDALHTAVTRFENKPVKWNQVAQFVETRTRIQCRQRWMMVLHPGTTKGPWKTKEDDALRAAVCLYKGDLDWNKLSESVPNRGIAQIRDRWLNHLDPNINKSAFSPAEDHIIVTLQARLGNKFAQIKKELPGRTLEQVKTRWRSMKRRNKNKNP